MRERESEEQRRCRPAAEEGDGAGELHSPGSRAALAYARLRRAELADVPLRGGGARGASPRRRDRLCQVWHGIRSPTATSARGEQQLLRRVQQTARALERKPKCTWQHQVVALAPPQLFDDDGARKSFDCLCSWDMASTPAMTVDSSGWIRCWKGLKRSTQRGRSSFLPSSLPHLLSLRQPRICISAAPFPHSSATEGVGGGHGATTASLESPDLGWQLQMAAAEASGGDRGKGVEELKMLNRIATVKDDGTVVVDVPSTLEATLVDVGGEDGYGDVAAEESLDGADIPYRPPMQIVILVVGTRGDVQPFVAIGKCLQDYGHRVRLATHANYKEFVLTAGLEFFPLGGDPKILVEYMVKNKGLLPSGPSEILIQRKQMKEIIFSLLPACKDPDPDTSIPFKVDAIIANPPAYGHTHVAEALKVPIHIFFTMPWTPTSEFPHPLSRVKTSAGYRLSYQIVDSMIWLGIGDMINEFRKKKLKLRPVTYLSGAQGSGSDIPHGYIWSPHLVPKPKDWGPKIDVVGFCFLDLASDYVPPGALVKWLEAGDKPIYIGFGSLPVQDPAKMTETIVQALEMTGQRGIINKGWGGLGTLAEQKDFVYVLDNCPHDWLFLQCKAVVHHGGAGTTAAGLKAACPTTIVPFFGDQQFWGERVHARGVGPLPIPVDQFNLQKLVDAIKFMLEPEVKEKAVELAKAMESEDGVTGAVRAFLKHLPSIELQFSKEDGKTAR